MTLIPTRSGNGAMEALSADGCVPAAATRRHRTERRRWRWRGSGGHERIFVDLWDLERFSACAGVLRRAPRSPARDEPRAAGPAADRVRARVSLNHEDTTDTRTADRVLLMSSCPVVTRRDDRPRHRHRHRRLRIRRIADRAGAAASRDARRADRARPSSPVRDRRVVHAARQSADRGDRGSLRSAARPRVLEVGHLAAGAP